MFQHILPARTLLIGASLAVLCMAPLRAQVSAYSFTQEAGTWQPITGGTVIGYQLVDDEVFVDPADLIGFFGTSMGPGFPIGFTFNYNGIPFDRVGISMEGWIALGQSSRGDHAVYVPIGGDAAYLPLATAPIDGLDPVLHHRIVAFGRDMRAQAGGPLRIRTLGTEPNRTFVVQWNAISTTSSGGSLMFQVRLSEGGGVPSAQTVQVAYGAMTPGSGTIQVQVGLGGADVDDFNIRSVPTAPYDWTTSAAGAANTANCGFSVSGTTLPEGLTYTWTPPACLVSGVTVTDIVSTGATASGTLNWQPVPGATSYDYVVTAGSATDPPLASASGVTGTTAALTGLPAQADLFAYVRANCGGAPWGPGFGFNARSEVSITCGAPPVQQALCYNSLQQYHWHYTSSDGSRLRAVFNAGYIGGGDAFVIYDGADATAPVLYTAPPGNSVLDGQQVSSTGPEIYMELTTDDIGSCNEQDWFTPWAWEVGCLDCDPVLATPSVQNDCANGEFSVQIAVASLGTATHVNITNDAGAPEVPVSGIGNYVSGPFPVGTPVTITVENPDNSYCDAVFPALINTPCPIVSCGPDTYTYCYGNNDASQWIYQAEGNERIGIRFLSGTLPGADVIRIYDGTDPFMSTPLYVGNNGGDLSGLLVTTTASNTEHAFMLEVAADGSSSCATGEATSWEYVVACYTGCAPPEATFTTVPDCDNARYSVTVNVTSLGSAASVLLVNDDGAPEVTATSTGIYTVGPFPAGQHVVIGVQGENVLCSLDSPSLVEDCGAGIHDHERNGITIYPNPGEGVFHIVLPGGFGGQGRLDVLDITGRLVGRHMLQGLNGQEFVQDLGYLPAGSYTLLLRNGGRNAVAMVRIVH